ncbi:MAG: hypothetical protein D4S01_10975 [Dehalococcoidia bacterium]|nr:MAG: hypothetical protein D4S01_10975 [Dehalococcoidia bacterium]
MVIAASSAQSWALFKEQVDDTIIKALQPKIIYPILCKTYPALSPSVEYNVTDSWLDADETAESGEYKSKVMSFTRKFATIKDVGIAPRIPINWIKDARWDLVNDHVEAIGFGIARKMNSDFLSAANLFVAGGTVDGQTYSAVSANVLTATALWSSTSADILNDISRALGQLGAENAGEGKKYLIVHPYAMQYIRLDPNLVKYLNYGDPALIQRGIYPTPFGVDILETSQAATTYALLINADLASLKYYEREPLTTEMEKSARSKNLDIVAYCRYAFACGRPKGIVKIDTISS